MVYLGARASLAYVSTSLSLNGVQKTAWCFSLNGFDHEVNKTITRKGIDLTLGCIRVSSTSSSNVLYDFSNIIADSLLLLKI